MSVHALSCCYCLVSLFGVGFVLRVIVWRCCCAASALLLRRDSSVSSRTRHCTLQPPLGEQQLSAARHHPHRPQHLLPTRRRRMQWQCLPCCHWRASSLREHEGNKRHTLVRDRDRHRKPPRKQHRKQHNQTRRRSTSAM